MRRGDLSTVASQVGVSQVVREKENYVGPGAGRRRGLLTGTASEQEEDHAGPEQWHHAPLYPRGSTKVPVPGQEARAHRAFGAGRIGTSQKVSAAIPLAPISSFSWLQATSFKYVSARAVEGPFS